MLVQAVSYNESTELRGEDRGILDGLFCPQFGKHRLSIKKVHSAIESVNRLIQTT